MKFWIIVMLCLDAAMLFRVWFDVVGRLGRPLPQPKWSALAVGLFSLGTSSSAIATHYKEEVGSVSLAFVGSAFMGMALMAALVMIREAPKHDIAVREQGRN